MVDVNNGLVGIVWALTGKFLRVGLESKEKGGSKKLGRGRKRQWIGQISKEGRKKGRENRRYENGEERWREKWESGKKEYKGWKSELKRVKERNQIEEKGESRSREGGE